MRIVVVQPRGHLEAASVEALGEPGASVGLLTWFDPARVFTVIVKVTFSYAGAAMALAAEQQPLSLGEGYPMAAAGGELRYPSDFVPNKPQADVLLAGHAYAEPGQARGQITAALTFGELTRRFVVQTDQPQERIVLLARHIRSITGEPAAPVGPVADGCWQMDDPHHGPDFDHGAYNVAPAAQRTELVAGARALRLEGLCASGPRELELPDIHPRVRVSPRSTMADFELEMKADTVWLDTDAQECVVVWRGTALLPHPRGLDTLVVSLEHGATPRDWEEILRSAPQGQFGFALTAENLDPAAQDEEEQHALQMARYEAMCHERAPEPLLSLERYVALAAELAERPKERKEVLAKRGYTEDTWTVEERAWLERMAEQAMNGDGRLVAEYGTLFVAAQDELAAPDEADVTLEQYAETLVALAAAEDMPAELERLGLTLARWLRLDRRFKKVVAEDEALAAELERLKAREYAKHEVEP